MAGSSHDHPAAPTGRLGTFAGVFTPSILTILGIILFLRVGFVVGSAGLPRALLIILLANTISVLTSISLSAVATNLRVKGGGDYYLISRTLGVQFGGALGLVLFLAQAVSIAFYAIGFGEAVSTLGEGTFRATPQAVAAIAVTFLLVLAWLGADWATRFQYVVMAVLCSAIVAFFAGGIPSADAAQLRANLEPGSAVPFWALFAIFFPAVTGFTQGVSMSGDLRDPGKSLPRGTFAAVGLSVVVYLGVAVLFAAVLPGAVMMEDTLSMRRISAVPWLIDAGVIAATLSSAMASFLGAPRILQSLAQDKVFPLLNPFAAAHGPSNNPRRGALLACGIAYGTIALGNLNAVASVVSMFFLISYGLLNYATYVEARAKSPSFRPRFRWFSARSSLAGAIACLGAMLAVQPLAGAVAIAVLFALHQYVSRTVKVERWADSDRSRRLQEIRDDLLAIHADLEHPRDWRPVLLAFSDSAVRRRRILTFTSWLEGGAGFTTVVRMIRGDGAAARRSRSKAEGELQREIDELRLPAFAKVLVTDDVAASVPVLLQSHGLGRVRANTVVLNWYDRRDDDDRPGLRAYGDYLRLALRFGCNVVLLAAGASDFDAIEKTRPGDRRIDVWFRDNATGRLTLLLAYLMTRSEIWEHARIRLFAAFSRDADAEEVRSGLRRMLEEVRIDADVEVVPSADAQAVLEQSRAASVVFLPFRIDRDVPSSVFGGDVDELAGGLGVTALVLASQDIELDSEPETGRHAEVAEAVDTATKARKLAARAQKKAEQAAGAADEARERLESSRTSADAAEGEIAELERAASAAEKRAEQLKRRAARVNSKAETAEKEAAELTGQGTDGES